MVCFGWLLFWAVASALDLSSLSGPLPYLGSQVEVNQPFSTPPYLQPQWSATVLFEGKSLGTQWKDRRLASPVLQHEHRAWAEGWHGRVPLRQARREVPAELLCYFAIVSPQLVANVPSTDNRTWGGFGVNGTCDTMGRKYADFFAWMALAKPIGEKVIHDTPCSVHRAEYAGPVLGDNDTIIMTACVVSNGTVLEVSQRIPAGKFSGTQTYRFLNISVGDPGETAFQSSYACAKQYPHSLCPSQGVQTLDIYRIFGKGEPLELQNRDTGDVLGDVSFVCTQGSGASYESKFITHWQVDVSTAFAQRNPPGLGTASATTTWMWAINTASWSNEPV
ncbi:unnamed protein product [Effrenium voratum]|nr:unnamed protein product [Effrenium voratum]